MDGRPDLFKLLLSGSPSEISAWALTNAVRNNKLTVFAERYRSERIEALQWKRIVYSGHEIRRMFEWKISNEDVADVVSTGEAIMEYPEDKPFQSCFMLGYREGRPIHVVAALDPATGTCHVITAYVPDPAVWQPGFRTRGLS